ncbi:MAG: hypothetical protein ACI8Z1_003020 [Candidatus Azotimanducaceae bacterium]|jgi:hypothetical protein
MYLVIGSLTFLVAVIYLTNLQRAKSKTVVARKNCIRHTDEDAEF